MRIVIAPRGAWGDMLMVQLINQAILMGLMPEWR